MAYPRRARDDDPTGNPGGLCSQILKLLEQMLDPNDYDEVGALVSQLAEVASAENIQNRAGAMDRALSVLGNRDPVKRLRQLLEAEREVQPVVGAIMGMDSAEMVYGTALSRLNVSTNGVHPSGFGHIFRAARDRQRARGGQPAAMNSAAAASFAAMFPASARIQNLG